MAMGLSLSLNLRPRMVQALQCTVCKTYMDPADKSMLTAKIFGAVPYRICSGCGTEVDEPTTLDQGYRRRWMRKLGLLKNSQGLTLDQWLEAAAYYEKLRKDSDATA